MNRRGAGIGLLGIGAVLYTGRYIGAAIIAQGMNIWAGSFGDALDIVGLAPLYLSIAAAAAGVIYLISAEMQLYMNKTAGSGARHEKELETEHTPDI